MYSNRFKRNVHVTRHARERMQQREIDEAQLSELLETGETRYKDQARLWIAKRSLSAPTILSVLQ